jgi:hypothetical protein
VILEPEYCRSPTRNFYVEHGRKMGKLSNLDMHNTRNEPLKWLMMINIMAGQEWY